MRPHWTEKNGRSFPTGEPTHKPEVRRAQADLQKLYADRETWARMSLKNIANSGIFSADRAVLDYARDIWYASPVPMGK